MRTVITGAGGMLAHAALGLLEPCDTLALARGDCDVTDAGVVDVVVGGFEPEVVLHFAAYTRVDEAENEPERARLVNVEGTANVARAAARAGALLVYISTDYVFSGDARTPYREDDPAGPLSVYGRTKLDGEARAREVAPRCLVVRTSWLFGPGGRNFVDTVAGRLRAGEALRVVDDQVGRPTFTVDLARGLLELVRVAPDGGTFHLTNTGDAASWYDVALEVASSVGADAGLVSRSSTSEQARPAARPAYSVLDVGRAAAAGVGPLRDWREAVAVHVAGAGAEP